jgi:hypothetical protein
MKKYNKNKKQFIYQLQKILIKVKVVTHLVEDSILVVSIVVKAVQHDHHVVSTLRNIVIF